MKIEFDVIHNPIVSFNEKFRRENTNEIGQVINEKTAELMILEFRKFLFLGGAQGAAVRRTTGYGRLRPKAYNDGQKGVSYESPYSAPPYIDRVWRSLIGYDRKYKEIGYKVGYGYLARIDPREGYNDRFYTYNKGRDDLMMRKEKLNPFNNLWPDYKDPVEFINDYDYTVWVPLSSLGNFMDYIGKNPIEVGKITSEQGIQMSQKINEDSQRQFPPELQGRPSYKKEIYFDEKLNEQWTNGDQGEVEMGFDAVIDFEFPPTLVAHVSRELMISIQQAEDAIFEYRKFIMIEGMTKYKLYPSELIEKVWLIHMGYSSNYIELGKNLPSKEFCYHLPFTGNSSGFDDIQNYKTTLDVYKIVYHEDPPDFCWPPSEIRFAPENFTGVFVNLIRLAGMYTVYSNGYLKPTEEPLKLKDIRLQESEPSTAVYSEKKAKIKARKDNYKSSPSYSGSSYNIFYLDGGPIFIGNPYYYNYGSPDPFGGIAEGFHEGLSILTDISFGDMLNIGGGDLGDLIDIDWPDLDFGGMADVAGGLFGDVKSFVGVLGEGVLDGVGDVFDGDALEAAGEVAGAVGEGLGDAAGAVGEGLGDFGEGFMEVLGNLGEVLGAVWEGIGAVAEGIGGILDVINF